MQFSRRNAWILASAIVFSLAPALIQAQDAPQQSDPTQTTQPPQPQQKAEVLRQAQDRVKARRKLRVQQIIQDTYSHKYETYFCGGYLRFRPGQYLQHNSESAWNVGITDYVWGKIGATADFRGYYGTTFTGVNQYQKFSPSISQYSFMAGPQVRFFEGLHWGWTGFVLAGVGHGNFGTGTNGLPPMLIGLYPDATVLNLTVGASVDYNLSPALALRISPNYLLTDYGSQLQHNRGFNAGVVYRFGRQH
jgi:hypothetical protein